MSQAGVFPAWLKIKRMGGAVEFSMKEYIREIIAGIKGILLVPYSWNNIHCCSGSFICNTLCIWQ